MKNHTETPCYNCDKMSPIFETLSKEELEKVSMHKTQVTYKPGEIIIKQGTPLTHIISFTSGLAKVYIEGKNDKNLLLHFLKPTEFLGGPGIFTDSKHYFSISTIEKSSVCFIELEIFKELLQTNLNFANSFMKYLSENSIFNYTRFISLTQKNMNGRIADALLYLQENIFEDKNPIRISRQDLADFTGMSKDSAIRVLKDLEKENILDTQGRSIHIRNIQKLITISKIS